MSDTKFIKDFELAKLKQYNRNPRLNDGAVGAVVKSIESFGFINPIVVDREFNVCAGHTRIKAATQMGLLTVPVIIAPQLVGDKFRAYNIADNQTASIAEWDNSVLAKLIDELKQADFPLDDLGFTAKQAEEILAGIDNYGTDFTLPDGDKSPFEQMTFTLSEAQAETVRTAMIKAKGFGEYIDTGNENSNGNAIARVCEVFNGSL